MSESGSSGALKGCVLLVFLGVVVAVLVVAGGMMIRPDLAEPTKEVTSSSTLSKIQEVAESHNIGVTSVTPVAEGAALSKIRARGTLLVGMDTGVPPWTGTPPMFSMSAAGEPDGFDHDLAVQIAASVGVPEVKLVHAKYSELEDLLLDPTGKIDLIASGYSPVEREGIAWSQPYLEYGLCLVVPAKSKIQTTADLFGKPVGIFDDDAAAEDVQRLVKGYTELVRMEDGYWDQLICGRFAGFLYDYPYTIAEIKEWYQENPSKVGSLRIAQYNLTDSTYAVGVRANEADLLAAVDQAIASWRASDAYGNAIKKWLKGGESLPAPKAQGRVVKVAAGDTLSGIAAKELGDSGRWKEIWAKNQDRFPNPNLIEVGDEVVLP